MKKIDISMSPVRQKELALPLLNKWFVAMGTFSIVITFLTSVDFKRSAICAVAIVLAFFVIWYIVRWLIITDPSYVVYRNKRVYLFLSYTTKAGKVVPACFSAYEPKDSPEGGPSIIKDPIERDVLGTQLHASITSSDIEKDWQRIANETKSVLYVYSRFPSGFALQLDVIDPI